jgi:hypothetical protein
VSWDIFVQDFPPFARTVSDIPNNFKPAGIGSRNHLIAKINELIPGVDFSDPSWGIVDGEDWLIELNMGREEDCKSFAFHVRGGDGAICVVAAILEHLALRAIDGHSGDFFTSSAEALESFRRWRAYRNHVMGRRPDPSQDR